MIVEIISDFHNPRNPKCMSCQFYDFGETWLVGKCISEETKVKSRERLNNSKGCISHKRISIEDFKDKIDEKRRLLCI